MQQPFLSGTLHVPILKVLSEQDHLWGFEFSRFHSCLALHFRSRTGRKRAIKFSYNCNIVGVALEIYMLCFM
ncbi:hypothetical protein COCC4DRAFT_177896, partial [Bipolaris maydis ATCC 48331]